MRVLNCFWFSEVHFPGVSPGGYVRVLPLDGAFSFPERSVPREFRFFPGWCYFATGSCCVLVVFFTWAVSRHSARGFFSWWVVGLILIFGRWQALCSFEGGMFFLPWEFERGFACFSKVIFPSVVSSPFFFLPRVFCFEGWEFCFCWRVFFFVS